MNASKKRFTWEHVLTLALLIASISLLISVLHRGTGPAAVPLAIEPALLVGTTRPSSVDLELNFQADEALLSRQIPLSVFHPGQTLDQALRAAADAAHFQLWIQWKPLEVLGIYRDTPIASEWPAPASAGQIQLRTALRWILSDTNGLHDTLDFTIDNGAIVITTADEVSKHTMAVVYNIRDLIDAGAPAVPGPIRQEVVDGIAGLIKDTVARESWTENGGTIGSIREMMGLLIVTQTRANHLELFELLAALRRTSRLRPELVSSVEPTVGKTTSTSIPPELRRTIRKLQFEDQVTCEAAIREVAAAAGVAVHVDWKSFLPVKIFRSTPIQGPSPLSNVSIAEAIHRILLPDEDIKALSFSAQDGIIVVALDRTTEIYNVRDLEAPATQPSAAARAPNDLGDNDLASILTSNIDPTSWDVGGGTIGHVQYLSGGLLVVTQTRPAHEKIVELLRRLREAKTAQHNP
ncbi:MAG TPA: hypothetical protein VH370_00960 [Humisphaera sp.]|nr:hypothetical protein [Humisphaera sp.]